MSTYGLTLAGLCRIAATRHGRDVVLIDDAGPVTAEQLDRWSATVAGEFANRGIVVSGGKLGVLARSGRGMVVATIAANRLGADAVLLHPAFSATQLAELLRVEELRAVVHDDEFGDLLAAARFRGTLDPGRHEHARRGLVAFDAGAAPSIRAHARPVRADSSSSPRGHRGAATQRVEAGPARRRGCR